MTTETDIQKTFDLLSDDSGNVTLTPEQQEDIITLFRTSRKQAAKKVRYAAIEIVQEYDKATAIGEIVDYICRDIQNIEV